jgi:hypothetical protein
MLCLVFSLAAVSQAPATDGNGSVTPAERQKALADEINRRNASPEARAKNKAKAGTEAARQKALKRARSAAARERERVDFERNAKLRAQAAEEYRKMQPYLLERQRMELERLSAFERNQALNRIAEANAASAQAINNMAALQYYAASRNPAGHHDNDNAAVYGPYGVGIMPGVQGAANTGVNAAAVYNNVFPAGGVSFP